MENDFEKDIRDHHPRQKAYPQLLAGGPGRGQGTPNKATTAAKEAIGLFVEGNIHRLQEWLDMIAHGYKIEATNPKTGVTYDKLIPPNPALAFDLFQSVVEYHIPKLTRSDVKQTEVRTLELQAAQLVTVDAAAQSYAELLRHVSNSTE